MEEAIEFAKKSIGFHHPLKTKQVETIKELYDERDCISVLPTGYGKSVIFQLLPWLLQYKMNTPNPLITIVISPLNSLMQDQVLSLASKGIKACYLNVEETEEQQRQRFQIELEFVQCLANPNYLNFLAQRGFFKDPTFINYLKYLQYWKEPKYAKFLKYPQCLHFLDLMQYEHFRKEMVNAQCAKFIDDQQLLHWQHYQRKRMALLHAEAEAQKQVQQQTKDKPG